MAQGLELQQQVQQLQQMSQQLQQVAGQRQQFEAIVAESEMALEALGELADDATVYRNIGSLLVQDAGKDAAIKRITDDMETMQVRLKRVKGQEDELRKAIEGLQEKLQAAFQAQAGQQE